MIPLEYYRSKLDHSGSGDAKKKLEQGWRASVEDTKPPIPTKLEPEDAQFKWELDHCGGYRLIFPLPDAEKYDKFLDQNVCSIFQETAASTARANLTRTQIDEYNVTFYKILTNKTTSEHIRSKSKHVHDKFFKLKLLAKETN